MDATKPDREPPSRTLQRLHAVIDTLRMADTRLTMDQRQRMVDAYRCALDIHRANLSMARKERFCTKKQSFAAMREYCEEYAEYCGGVFTDNNVYSDVTIADFYLYLWKCLKYYKRGNVDTRDEMRIIVQRLIRARARIEEVPKGGPARVIFFITYAEFKFCVMNEPAEAIKALDCAIVEVNHNPKSLLNDIKILEGRKKEIQDWQSDLLHH